MRTFFAAVMFLTAFPVFAGEDCTCKYKDLDVREGDTICMQTPNGSQVAQCSRVLNNTSWKFLGATCPLSSLENKTPNLSTFNAKDAEGLLEQG